VAAPLTGMKSYAFTAHGGPEVEALMDLARPEPGPGQLLVAVQAAGVNPADWKRRTGLSAGPEVSLPAVFGREAAGVVVRAGAGVAGFAPGDAVFGSSDTGGFAEYALLPEGVTAHRPPDLPVADAATLPVAAATAFDGLAQLDLPPGSTLLVIGVGGGVGVAVAQLAVHAGLNVVGTASVAKKEFVEALGVTHVRSGFGVTERACAAAPAGVDAIYDLVGGPDLEALAVLLPDRAKLITAADRETAVRLGGGPVRRARNRKVLDQLAQLAVSGVLRPFVTAVHALEKASDALRAVGRARYRQDCYRGRILSSASAVRRPAGR
jgi:NADPH:quinone reductase-like Zn-dependent oxidoreductase